MEMPKHWKRPRGRSRTTCRRSTVKDSIAPLSIDLATARRRAQNRTGWWRMVETPTLQKKPARDDDETMMMMNSPREEC